MAEKRIDVDFDAALNPEQLAAVTHGDGPQLVLAGAGSGKTRVITYRIAWLVGKRGVDPAAITAVTFTNKAAGEMKERVAALTGAAARVMWVMTFHSACARILRQHADRLAYKRGFTIYDQSDQMGALREAMRAVKDMGRDGERRFDVTVRLPPSTREDIGAISRIMLPLKDGSLIPLSAVADVSMATGRLVQLGP